MSAKKRAKKTENFLQSPIFKWMYASLSVCTLLITTLYWSFLSAKIQIGNSDQLVDPRLFENLKTFHSATFPGAHTFLLKWPIFWLIKTLGSTSLTINNFTVGLVLLTIIALIICLYKIERRPLVFGTMCLALASALLMIPAQPYAGALLPLNMAMLATRNIEYILFIVSIVIFIRSPKIRSWRFWLSVLCLSLLIASDKLFLIFAIGGALISLILYARSSKWNLVSIIVNWLIVGILATLGAFIILAVISNSGLTHLANQTNAGPYSLNHSTKQLALGGIYAALGLLTNFGANPAFDVTQVRDIFHQGVSRLFSLNGPAYVINLVILGIGLFAVYAVIRSSWASTYRNHKKPDRAIVLSVLLIWSSVVALLSFIGSIHYYAVDGRYLTITLFAVFIAFATYARTKKWRPEILVSAGLICAGSIAFGIVGAMHFYNNDKDALAPQTEHNALVANALAQHKVDVLAGDYWRVMPVKQVSTNNLNVMPLATCTQPLQALSSAAWQPKLNNTKFAYLLTLNGSLTDHPNCSLKQAVNAYGKPNASALISGSLNHPDELLLFYDRGINISSPKTPQPSQGPATVVPITLSQLSNTTCSVQSITNIVAHQDDDLLFMNPDLLHEIKAGDCIRTIYITAGDAGQNQFYWLSREEGTEAAYSYMLGTNDVWIQKIVELSNNEYVTIANPKGNTKVSLIFMHLPDGNLKGQGFSSSNYETLQKLESEKINTIHSVDHQSYYTSDQLINALSTLMNIYETSGINTQAGFVSKSYPDHSDHLAVNWFVKQAYQRFETQKYADQVTIPIKFYIGYPIHQMPANVSGPDLTIKENTFLQYTKYDGSTCQTIQICQQTPTYSAYLSRQYQNGY